MRTRKEMIARHRAEMPKVYRGTYDKAVSGKSLRAAVNSFCCECTMWQRAEVRLCTSLGCQLFPYRPYRGKAKHGSKNTSEGADFSAKSKNSGKEDELCRTKRKHSIETGKALWEPTTTRMNLGHKSPTTTKVYAKYVTRLVSGS